MRVRINNQKQEGLALEADAKAVLEQGEEKEKKGELGTEKDMHQRIKDIQGEQFMPVERLEKYDLSFMSENTLAKHVIEFKCIHSGFKYRVIDLDGIEKTNTISWQQFPQFFPHDDREIWRNKDKLLPEILKTISGANHTQLEGISRSSLFNEEKNFFDFNNRLDQLIKELEKELEHAGGEQKDNKKVSYFMLITELRGKRIERKEYLNSCWVTLMKGDISEIKKKNGIANINIVHISSEILCQLYVELDALPHQLFRVIGDGDAEAWGLERFKELRKLIEEFCILEMYTLSPRFNRNIVQNLNQSVNPSEDYLTDKAEGAERVKPEFNVCLAVVLFFILPIVGFFIYLWYHERSCHRFLEETKVNSNSNPNPNPTTVLPKMTTYQIHSVLTADPSFYFVSPQSPRSAERSREGAYGDRSRGGIIYSGMVAAPRSRKSSPEKSSGNPLSRSTSLPQELSSRNQSARSPSPCSLQQPASSCALLPSSEATPISRGSTGANKYGHFLSMPQRKGSPEATPPGSISSTPRRRALARVDESSGAILTMMRESPQRSVLSSNIVAEESTPSFETPAMLKPDTRRNGHTRGSSAPLAGLMRVVIGDSRDQKEEGARGGDVAETPLLKPSADRV